MENFLFFIFGSGIYKFYIPVYAASEEKSTEILQKAVAKAKLGHREKNVKTKILDERKKEEENKK